jgi:hypothetical protein
MGERSRSRYAIVLILTMVSVVGWTAPSNVKGSDPGIQSWSDPINIAAGDSYSLRADGSSVYLLGSGSLTASHDFGATWSTVSMDYGKIWAADGALYRVFLGDDVYYGGKIEFSVTRDSGVTWSDPVLVFELESNNDDAFGVCKFSSTLFVYSYDQGPGTYPPGASIKVSRSTDDGVTWSIPVTVASGIYTEDPISNDMAYANGVLYVAYDDHSEEYSEPSIVVSKSEDMGDSWTAATIATGTYVFNPMVVADPATGTLHLSYIRSESSDGGATWDSGIRYVRSDDGVTWSSPVEIGSIDDMTDPVGWHFLVASSGKVFEGYTDYHNLETGSTLRVHISSSLDGGVTWTDLGDVTALASNSIIPLLGIGDEKLHFAWTDVGSEEWWTPDAVTYYRSLLLVDRSTGEATLTRTAGAPSGNSQVMSYAPDEDGSWFAEINNNGLVSVRVLVIDTTDGTVLIDQMVLLTRKGASSTDSPPVPVLVGHEYSMKLIPFGRVGASADVVGMFDP